MFDVVIVPTLCVLACVIEAWVRRTLDEEDRERARS